MKPTVARLLDRRELGQAVVREHLRPGSGYFDATTQWDKQRSWDRTWS